MKTKGEKTRHHIIQVAAELFWKNSYQGVNTNTISNAAGVNKATLYRYFPSKEDIALAAIKNYCDRTIAHVFEASLQAKDDPSEQLGEIYFRVYELAVKNFHEAGCCPGCPLTNLVVEMATANPALREAVSQCFDEFRHYYRQIVQTAQQNGLKRGVMNEDQTVEALINLMNGAMVASKVHNQPQQILDTTMVAQQILEA